MFTATMIYKFKPESLERACKIWQDEVLALAVRQPGFVRMQFLTARNEAMAIGSWRNEQNARDFMATGVFKQLMEKLESLSLIEEQPKHKIWDLRYCEEK